VAWLVGGFTYKKWASTDQRMENIFTGLGWTAGGILGANLFRTLPTPATLLSKLYPKPHIVYVDDSAFAYGKLETYIVTKFTDAIRTSQLQPRGGELRCSLVKAQFADFVEDSFEGQPVRLKIMSDTSGASWRDLVESSVDMYAHTDSNASSTDETGTVHQPSSRVIAVSSWTLSVDALRRYVLGICKFRRDAQLTTMYVVRERLNQRERHVEWEELHVRTNKRVSNTIVSRTVERELLADVADFMTSERQYNAAGIPYTKGYLLYGEPGTGKSSLIKAIAAEYNLPVFIIDFDTVVSNADLLKVTKEMTEYTDNKPFILAMEDLDRSTMFSHPHHRRDNVITAQALLNAIDGLVESHGRIMFITTNNANVIRDRITNGALMRPGRVDKEVEIGLCDFDQVQRMLFHFYGIEHECIQQLRPDDLKDGAAKSPAVIQQLFQRHGAHGTGDPRILIAQLFNNTDVGGLAELPTDEDAEVVALTAQRAAADSKLRQSYQRGNRLKVTLRNRRRELKVREERLADREAYWLRLEREVAAERKAVALAEKAFVGWKKRRDALVRKAQTITRELAAKRHKNK